MLALQCKDLVVELGGLSGVVVALLVVTAGQVLQFIDGSLHTIDALLCEDDLVAHARDANAQAFVVSLDVVQTHLLVL